MQGDISFKNAKQNPDALKGCQSTSHSKSASVFSSMPHRHLPQLRIFREIKLSYLESAVVLRYFRLLCFF